MTSIIGSIERIDILVHPDANLARINSPLIDNVSDRTLLRTSWDKRVDLIAKDPKHAMIYFSAFINTRPMLSVLGPHRTRIEKEGQNDLWNIEKSRIRRFRERLGSRLFVSAGYPTGEEVIDTFLKRGYILDFENVDVLAYGEYYDRCVNIWGSSIAGELEARNYTRIPELSLVSESF